jgi:hypothetical protein
VRRRPTGAPARRRVAPEARDERRADHAMASSISAEDRIDPAPLVRAAPRSAEHFGLLGG